MFLCLDKELLLKRCCFHLIPSHCCCGAPNTWSVSHFFLKKDVDVRGGRFCNLKVKDLETLKQKFYEILPRILPIIFTIAQYILFKEIPANISDDN